MSRSLTHGGREYVPGIPGACAPASLPIWQEAHSTNRTDEKWSRCKYCPVDCLYGLVKRCRKYNDIWTVMTNCYLHSLDWYHKDMFTQTLSSPRQNLVAISPWWYLGLFLWRRVYVRFSCQKQQAILYRKLLKTAKEWQSECESPC